MIRARINHDTVVYGVNFKHNACNASLQKPMKGGGVSDVETRARAMIQGVSMAEPILPGWILWITA